MPYNPVPNTPWQTGSFQGRSPKLLFGRMFEDPTIELQAFPPRSRVFCIASAGCTARALAAAGHRVSAVDINPIQLDYARSRATGSPAREGSADRLIALGRHLLPLLGWTERNRTFFLNMTDPAEQLDYWDHHLDSPLWRAAIDTLLSPSLLRLAYASPFIRSLRTESFGEQIRARLRRGWATHPNCSNRYAWKLLLNQNAEEPAPPMHPIQFACADAATFLESCPPQTFDAFSLSNITDGASPAYLNRLTASVQHAATRTAVVVTRSFADQPSEGRSNHAQRDRSLLWGTITVADVAHALVRVVSPLMATPAEGDDHAAKEPKCCIS
jgi:S-adenosylmethionine:diacylglycerol 3-amino-3-carboxypropyl transferase